MAYQAFSMVPNSAVLDQSLGHSAFRVLCILSTYRNSRHGWCNPALKTIAIQLGLAESSGEAQISRAIKELKEKSYIRHVPGGGRISSRYQVILDLDDPGPLPIEEDDNPALIENDKPSLFENNNQPPVKNNKGTRLFNQTKEQEEYISSRFEQFWKIYPRREGKGQAEKAYRAAAKQTDPETINAALQRQLPSMLEKEAQFRKLPATWLNGKCWLDESPSTPPSKATDSGRFF